MYSVIFTQFRSLKVIFNKPRNYFQSKCSTEAVIRDWRVTICDDWSKNDTENCRNALHRLAFFSRQRHFSRGYLEVRPLKDCQLYTVAISPAMADGSPIMPGERYTSIHSTLCAPSITNDVEEGELQPALHHTKSINSELVVVLITMVMIGSAMVGLALKSVTSNGTHNPEDSLMTASMTAKTYYNPASSHCDDYSVDGMKA